MGDEMRLAGWAVLVVVGAIASVAGVGAADSGDVSVTTPGSPTETRVQLAAEGDGPSFRCPETTQARLEAYRQRLARVESEFRGVRREHKLKTKRLDQLDKRYPGNTPTQAVADEYNGLLAEAKRLETRAGHLVAAHNRANDRANATLEADCTS
jgi:hypothetical protein